MSDAPTMTGPHAATAVTAPLPPLPAAVPARAATACRACSAPLAPDQRYCLECGARVGAARVELPALAAAADGGGPPAGAAPHGDRRRRGGSFSQLLDRVGGPMGAAAVVLVALGIGFLLGQGDEDPGGPATVIQRPPVINLQSGGAAAGTATDGATTDGGPAATGTRGRAGRGAAGGTGSTAGVAPATPDDAGGDLDRLQQQPTEQATQGEAPRRDNRASGGGTEAETIG